MTRGTHIDKTKLKVQVVEVGYTSDLSYQDKYVQKQEQHQRLLEALQRQGWTTQLHVIVLGVAATAFTTTTTALTSLGISPDRVKKCTKKLLEQTVASSAGIIRYRRHLEHQSFARTGVG